MFKRARIVGVCAAVAAAVLVSVPAAATAPRAGASYKGQVTSAAAGNNSVTFNVSKDGTLVKRMRVGPFPINSCGNGGSPPSQSSKPAPIKQGKFTAHVVYRGGDTVIARATVTGTFLRKGKEKGVLTTVMVGAPNCGLSYPYTAHAQ